ncbi:hypothetical protein [uncultured Brevundimonas sp.]|uniref:hypothetical protein n=1 Tax=uncultured Brevundimonas sp. TaxID=213418 RepID=UPI00262EC651|nr:hypothetical protein [uncultured Brevundimonas sp.]
MTNDTNPPANETPIQRAFRQKQEALAKREKAPRGGAFQREQNKRIEAGKSRPWMTK